MLYRVAYILQNGTAGHKDFETLELCYEFLLSIDYKRYNIMDLKSKDIIERG
jgi:hypothetical protein